MVLKYLIPIGAIIVVAAIVIPIAIVFTRSEETEDTPLVNTTFGMIRGRRAEDGSSMFLGIPYAMVNESNPFGAAIVDVTFDGTFDAFDDSARCPQIVRLNDTSLDCLHLHVHVPKTEENGLLPVFVYIHGGGFYNRSAGRDNIGPKFLIRHDVIFVSINYRLSVYGFMCLNTPEVPGNQGLKDQLNALRWIKKNIRAFGGDDENITITGDSAGGIAVHLHLLFAEEGLFNKAITQSGTGFSPWVFHEPNVNAAIMIANRLGFETNFTSAALEFLSNQTPHDVMLAVTDLGIVPGPCVEPEFPNVERFAPSHPVNTPSPNARNVTLLSGYNSDEWLLMYANMPAEGFENLDIFNRNLFFGFQFGAKQIAMEAFVRRFYAADEPISINQRRAVIDFDSDFIVNHPTQRTLRQHLNHGGVAYHYLFSYVGDRNAQVNLTERGAAHSDELRYLYDMPDLTETPTPEDQLIIDRITTLWTNFAKYGYGLELPSLNNGAPFLTTDQSSILGAGAGALGAAWNLATRFNYNPTPTPTELLPVQWVPATLDRLNYLTIDTTMEIRTRPFYRRLSFWDFFYHANREYVRGFVNGTL